MGYKSFDQKEKEYQTEVKRLVEIACDVYNSDRSDFLRTLADAWLKADKSNKRILREAWAAIVIKYDLAKEDE